MSHSSKTEKYLFGFLLFTVFWLPLALGANRPWAWALMQASVFFITCALLFSNRTSLSRLYVNYRGLIIVWLVFLCWQLINIFPMPIFIVEALRPERISHFTLLELEGMAAPTWLSLSFDVGQSTLTFVKSLSYFFLFFISLILVNNHKRLKQVLIVVSSAGIFQALYGAIEVLSGITHSLIFKVPVTHIATGSFIYKNHYANFLLLSLAAAIGYLIANLHTNVNVSNREKLRRAIKFWLSSKVLFRIGVVLIFVALVMSRSRMGNGAFFVSMTLTATLGLIYFKPRHKSYVTLFISMLVIDILIVSSLFGLKEVQQRLEQTNLAQESRDEVITDALPLLKRYVFLGTGGGTFYTVFPQVQGEDNQHFYDHAHNEFLQFSIEFGVVGSASLFLLVFMCAKKAFDGIRSRRHPLPRGAAFACVMAITGMTMHSSVDFPLQAPANTAIFIVLLALGVLSKSISIKSRRV